MKRLPLGKSLSFAAMLVAGVQAAEPLEDGFRNPPHSAKPHAMYHLMNCNITKEGVTRDFEEIAKAGLGGVQMFNIGSDAPPGRLRFASPEWFDFMRHVQCEAKRLGLEVAVLDASGWSGSGGPWITPEYGMKVTTFTETRVKGPAKFDGVLPRTRKDNGFYGDIAVVAYPTPVEGASLRQWREKAGLRRHHIMHDVRISRDSREFPGKMVVPKERIVDLTGRMDAGGRLAWDVPPGDWTILRIGFVCNGRLLHPVSEGAQGHAVDRFSAKAHDIHFNAYFSRLFREIGLDSDADRTAGVNAVYIDSAEAGCQNWTQGLEKTFERRMGYSLVPWLPLFAKRVVGSVDESERVLEDFRRLLADLFVENHAGRFADRCHAFGLKVYIEPYGIGNFDNLQYGKCADVPTAEFWNRACLGESGIGGPGNSRFAAYLAHVWGRRFAAAESFTSSPPLGGKWMATPFSIKSQCDRSYADGVNLIVYHRYTHQPWPGDSYLPGMTMGRHGMHLDRTQTWWKYAPAWFSYQSRCQWMLQEGIFVADVLFVGDETAPNDGFGDAEWLNPEGDLRERKRLRRALPAGYAWDVCDGDALSQTQVKDDRLVVPGGVVYKVLVLPKTDTMSERMLRRVGELIDAGAKVAAPCRPKRTPGMSSLRGNGYSKLVDGVWSRGVIACDAAEAVKRIGIAPDFDCTTEANYIHRRDASADWYFVACDNATNVSFEAAFRVVGKVPEIWDAETGEITDARFWRAENGRTVVRLDFPPSGSAFVVFRREIGKAGNTGKSRESRESGNAGKSGGSGISGAFGPWQVSFPVDWYSGGTNVKSFTWSALKDWTTDDDPDVKYFSGTATYCGSCALPRVTPGARVVLDLGEVKNFAEVTVNGKAFPVLWRPPFRVDITDVLTGSGCGAQSETLDLEIKVTNLWPNRLIGDDVQFADDCVWRVPPRGGEKRKLALAEIPEWVNKGGRSPTGRHTFTTYRHWTKKDKPIPSGLLGPVHIR